MDTTKSLEALSKWILTVAPTKSVAFQKKLLESLIPVIGDAAPTVTEPLPSLFKRSSTQYRYRPTPISQPRCNIHDLNYDMLKKWKYYIKCQPVSPGCASCSPDYQRLILQEQLASHSMCVCVWLCCRNSRRKCPFLIIASPALPVQIVLTPHYPQATETIG